MENASAARRFYGENVSRFSEAAEQVHPRHGLRDTGDWRHDHHGHRPCRRSGGQAPQRREPTEPQPAGRGTSRKDQRRHPGRRRAVHRQEHARHLRPDGRLQAPLVQDGEALARPGRKQVVEGERRDDAGLPRVHGRRLQVGRTEDRAARPQDLVLARRGPQGRERGSPRRHAGRRQGDGRTRHPRLRQGNIPRPKVAAKRCPSMGGTGPPSTTTSSTTRGSSSRA